MMVKRKTPIRHKVRSHIREGKKVRSFERGKGSRPKQPKRVVGRDASSKILKYTDPISKNLEKAGTWELKHADMNPEDPHISYYRVEDRVYVALRKDKRGRYIVEYRQGLKRFDNFNDAMIYLDRVQRALPIQYWDKLKYGSSMYDLPNSSDDMIQEFFLHQKLQELAAIDPETKYLITLPMKQLIFQVEMHDYLRHYLPLKYFATKWQETPEYRQSTRKLIERRYREELSKIVEKQTQITVARRSSLGRHGAYRRIKKYLKKKYPDEYRIETVWHTSLHDNIDEIQLPKSLSLILKEVVEQGIISIKDIESLEISRYGGMFLPIPKEGE